MGWIHKEGRKLRGKKREWKEGEGGRAEETVKENENWYERSISLGQIGSSQTGRKIS